MAEARAQRHAEPAHSFDLAATSPRTDPAIVVESPRPLVAINGRLLRPIRTRSGASRCKAVQVDFQCAAPSRFEPAVRSLLGQGGRVGAAWSAAAAVASDAARRALAQLEDGSMHERVGASPPSQKLAMAAQETLIHCGITAMGGPQA